MQTEILIEHLKYVDDHYEFSDKASEKDRNFMLDNEYVLSYDGHMVLSEKGADLLDNSYNNFLDVMDMDDEDLENFNTSDEDFRW